MNDSQNGEQQAQAQTQANTAEQAQAEPRVLFAYGTTKIAVAPIKSFEGLLDTAGKVANLIDVDSTDVALAMSVSHGAVAAALHSNTKPGFAADDTLADGLAGLLVGVFQIAANEGMPVSYLLEKARASMEAEAQAAAIDGVRNFFAERGLASL